MQHNIYRRIAATVGLALLILVLAALPVYFSPAQAQQNDEPTPVRAAATPTPAVTAGPIEIAGPDQERETLLRQAAQETAGPTFAAGLVKIVGDWALVNFRAGLPAEPQEEAVWEVRLGLAHWDGAAWTVALEPSDQFLAWLAQIPETLLSPEARSYLNPTVSVAANAPGLWLPFPVGQTWKYIAGPHGSPGREAVDFGPFRLDERIEPQPLPAAPFTGRERDVTAAASGVVVDQGDNFLILRHGGNPPWETGYASLAATNLNLLGRIVFQGQRLGAASIVGNPAKGAHVHFWIRRPGGLDQPIDGQILSDWRIYQDNGYTVGPDAGRIVYQTGQERVDCQTVERFRLAGSLCHVGHFSAMPDPLPAAVVSLTPVSITIPLGETSLTEVAVGGATNLYGVRLELTYTSPASLTVVDAFPGTPGIQVRPGTVFEDVPAAILQNKVDPVAGIINFWAELQVPAPAFNGDGSLIELTWQRQQTGPVQVKLNQIHLTDPNGRDIPTVITPTGQMDIQSGFVLQGQVALQGRDNHSGVVLAVADRQLQTGTDGQFKVGVGHRYRFTLTAPGYLGAQSEANLTELGFADASTIDLGRVVLPGGDVTGDGRINIFDLAFIAARYRSSDPQADINADGIVNIFDLTMSAANYGQQGPLILPVATKEPASGPTP